MNIERRTLLQAALAAPWVHGLSDLGQDKPASRPSTGPDPFAAALGAMKQLAAPGLAIAIPETEAERVKLAAALNDMLESAQAPTVLALFLRAVWVCAPAARLPLKNGENVVLLDPVGARVEGLQLPVEQWENPSADRWCIGQLHAALDRFEKARRAAMRSKDAEPGERELEAVVASGAPTPEYYRMLQETAALCVPGSYILWTWRTTPDKHVRDACEQLIRFAWTRPDERNHLPFGVVEAKLEKPVASGGCGSPGSMIACGMALPQRRSLFVLRFLGESPAK